MIAATLRWRANGLRLARQWFADHNRIPEGTLEPEYVQPRPTQGGGHERCSLYDAQWDLEDRHGNYVRKNVHWMRGGCHRHVPEINMSMPCCGKCHLGKHTHRCNAFLSRFAEEAKNNPQPRHLELFRSPFGKLGTDR